MEIIMFFFGEFKWMDGDRWEIDDRQIDDREDKQVIDNYF